MEHAHWVNLQIMERFREEGIEFAFPTQTVHLTQHELPEAEQDGDSRLS